MLRGFGIGAVLLWLSGSLHAGQAGPAVTLVGNTMTHTYFGEKERGVFVYVLDGPPEIRADFEKIIAEGYPEKGLDADAAEKLQDQFTRRLKYSVTGTGLDKLLKETEYGSKMLALTGVVEEKDGRKWLNIAKYEPAQFKYPARMLAPDKPFVMPDKPPLELRINDALSLKCLWIPAGTFFMGCPYYQHIRWQEDPPHRVTLTRPYYISEIPVTQEIFEAVMGHNPSPEKNPKFPVMGLYCEEMYKFCKALSEKSGRKVRLPTAAEWEYAARAGTSNPTFPEKHAAQNNPGGDAYSGTPGPVKAKQPNAWGLYDLCCNSWELVSDGTNGLDRQARVDPEHLPPADKGEGDRKHDHIGKGGQKYPISEMEFLHPADGKIIRFRVVVEP